MRSSSFGSQLSTSGVPFRFPPLSTVKPFTGLSVVIVVPGLFGVIISPSREEESQDLNLNDIANEIYEKVQSGVKKSEAIKNTAKEYGINKKEVYSLYHEKYD